MNMNRLHLTLVGMAVTLLAGCAQKQEESLKFMASGRRGCRPTRT